MLSALALERLLLRFRPSSARPRSCDGRMCSALFFQGSDFFRLRGRGGCIGCDCGMFSLLLDQRTLFFFLGRSAFLGLLFQLDTVFQALGAIRLALRPLGHTRLPLQLV